jgi:hypothetical protein
LHFENPHSLTVLSDADGGGGGGLQSMYGFILTNFHPWVCAVLERDIEARHVLALPELYSVGQSPVRARA